MDTHAPLVIIRDFGAAMEGHLAHSALEAAGIESIVRPDDCGGMRPNLQISGVQLLVRPADVAEAERILTADLR